MMEESSMDAPFVELKDVTRCFGMNVAVQKLSLSIGPGVCYGLIGRNGAGKSSLLRLIMGMLRPDRGEVRLFGHDPIRDAEKAKLHVGYLAEDQAFPPTMSPSELFRFYSDCYPSWDWDFADTLVKRFGVPIHRPFQKLSRGEQRQAGLVSALAHRPKLLVLDEPGGGLDPVVRRTFLGEIVDLLAAEERTVIFSSHNLYEIERIATRIGILEQGRLLLDEEADRLKEGSCRVLAEIGESTEAQIRTALPTCVQAIPRDNAWQLTLLCTEDQAKASVASTLKGRIRDSRSLPLEDLFVSLVE
jgi:ABC-2 type transport system ATP-binding protein